MFFRRAFANKQQNLKNSNEYCDETSSNEAADFRHWQMKVQQQQHLEQVRNSQYNQHNGHAVHHNQINYAPHHQTQVLNGNYQNLNGSYQLNGNAHQFINQNCINGQSAQPQHCSARRGSFGEKEKQLKTSAINCGGGLRLEIFLKIFKYVKNIFFF